VTTPYILSSDPNKDIKQANAGFFEWIRKQFFQNSQLHNLFFDIGLQGAFLFDEAIAQILSSKAKAEIIKSLSVPLRLALSIVLQLLAQLKLEKGMLDEHKQAERVLLRLLDLKKGPKKKDIESTVDGIAIDKIVGAWDYLLSVANTLIDAVFHDHADPAPTTPDWDWLQQGIKEAYGRGDKYPALHLLANGAIVTGPVEREGISWLRVIEDTEKEVIFCDHSKGIMVVINTTWEELKSGKHFPVS
jgi:hypothetical protein